MIETYEKVKPLISENHQILLDFNKMMPPDLRLKEVPNGQQ